MKKNKNLLRKDIGSFLQKARKNKSLTGHQLGNLMQVSQQQISRYERGETSINIETLDIMLDILDKSWTDFFFSVIASYPNDESEIK